MATALFPKTHLRHIFTKIPPKTPIRLYSTPPPPPPSPSPSTTKPGGLVNWYSTMTRTRPIFTKSITSALIFVAADLSSQSIEIANSGLEGYDWIRTLRMGGYGLVMLGPSLHFWFNFMSSAFPGRDLVSTVKKMVLAQGVYGPVKTVIFFSANAALQGESGSEIFARLKRDIPPSMINGFVYWTVCDFVTFKFTPVHLQPLVSNGFSYVWTVYMTYMANLEKVSTS